MVTLTISCPTCGEPIEVEAEVDPGDANYGADADGNRGIFVGPSVETPDYNDEPCDNGCQDFYEPQDRENIAQQLLTAARDYRYEPRYPGDDL